MSPTMSDRIRSTSSPGWSVNRYTGFWIFLSEADAAAVREKVRAKFPARRLGQAADVGHAAVFLMTNPYVTGTVLDVTGGEQLVDWAF